MTTKGYNRLYLEDAMANMGDMFEYAHLYSGDFSLFFERLLTGWLQEQISCGNPVFIAGLSGKDLADLAAGGELTAGDPALPEEKSGYYWCGWAYAYLAWDTGRSLKYLVRSGLDIDTMLSLYPVLHEADISKVAEICGEIIRSQRPSTGRVMKTVRKSAGLTQERLAERTGVSLRMIRAYEQGSQDLAKAEYASVRAISRALGCSPEYLVG